MDWYMAVLKKYATFEGRARRKEYWMFALISFIISVVLTVVDRMIGMKLLENIYSLAILIPSLAVGARRLHDTGRSGWWLLIGLIPLIGWIWLIVLFATEGTAGPNQYGANPKDGVA